MLNPVTTVPSPEFRALEQRFALAAAQPVLPLAQRRAALLQMASLRALPVGVQALPGWLGAVPCLQLVALHPHTGPNPGCVLFLHGGAYQVGSAASHRGLAAALTLASGWPVWSVDYRLAPEHPLPAALDDAIAAYTVLSAMVPDQPIALVGDSAGGGLALALAQAITQRGLRPAASLVLCSPWVDLRCIQNSYQRLAQHDVLMKGSELRDAAAQYLAGAGADDPRASPLLGPCKGLPRSLIQVGSNEILLDDAVALEAGLYAAGVAVELQVWQHMAHAWQHFSPAVPEAVQAVAAMAAFIRQTPPAAAAGFGARLDAGLEA